MHPHHFSMNEKNSYAYYSVNEPTLIESVPRTREILNIMQVTRDIKELFENFHEEVSKGSLKIENTPIYALMKNVHFDFFHSEPDPANQLRLSNSLPKEDSSLLIKPQKYGNRAFCDSSSFTRGCIRLCTKK